MSQKALDVNAILTRNILKCRNVNKFHKMKKIIVNGELYNSLTTKSNAIELGDLPREFQEMVMNPNARELLIQKTDP
jgi:hypothetical protein